jgi:hypothetical protein
MSAVTIVGLGMVALSIMAMFSPSIERARLNRARAR